MVKRLASVNRWIIIIALLLFGCEDRTLSQLPQKPVQDSTCTSVDTGTILCRDGNGSTTERPAAPENPFEEGKPLEETAGKGRCRVAGLIQFRIHQPNDVARLARIDRLGKYIALSDQSWFEGKAKIKTNRIKRYRGELTIRFFRGPGQVPITHPSLTLNEINIPATNRTQLQSRINQVNRQLANERHGFIFNPPANLGRTLNYLEEEVKGVIQWEEKNRTPAYTCKIEQSIKIRWFHIDDLQDYAGPNRGAGNPNKLLRVSTRPNRVNPSTPRREDPPVVVAPLELFWPVTQFGRCCGQRCKHKVVQFARAVLINGPFPNNTRGKPWSLDIKGTEKARARNGRPYDPTFTNNPRGSGGDARTFQGSLSGGGNAVVQFDAPGLSRFLYNQFLVAPNAVTFKQQFIAFFVCEPKTGSSNLARRYLAKAKIVKIVKYTVTWQFPGLDRINKRPRIPSISGTIDEVVDTNLGAHAALRCKEKLQDLLRINGLLDAYRRPRDSKLEILSPSEHERLKESVRTLRLRTS